MKSNFMKTIFGVFAVLLVISSCKRDDIMVKSTDGTAPALTASANTLVLSSDNAASEAVAFNFNKASYGYSAAVLYTLQLDKEGNNFAAPKEYTIDASANTQKLTVGDLNNSLALMGYAAGRASGLEARIKSELRAGVGTLYSNVLKLTVTTYSVIIAYPSLYVPGAYQGWTPATAAKVASVADNGKYEGYVDFTAATDFNFKYTADTEWKLQYGWASSSNTGTTAEGTFAAGASGNLFVPSAGYYLLKADTKANTWNATKTTFGVVGDATPNGWDKDTNMTYDPATKQWKVTVNLTAGKIKFRANGAWVIQYGNKKTNPTNFLEFEGADIPVTVAGNYTIILDLSNPGNYMYSLNKN
ncbi:SusE domain-containing protein [Mucilaginibacter phyllosphaerae]|nr:SusE domain-containing protein [Mucilaginibacter phyllosphaerae]MBB3969184.1 hypothetical protein [Mucilaginibacter phyllosphaerae]